MSRLRRALPIQRNPVPRLLLRTADDIDDQGAALLSAVVSVVDSTDPEEIDRIIDGLPDFIGFAYRFSMPSSLLQRSVGQ